MKFSHFFCLLISILILLFVTGCSVENEDSLGIYTCARIELEGEDFHVLDVYPDGCSIRLSKWGQAWLTINDDSFYGRWELEADKFSLDINGTVSVGTLSDGVCMLRFGDAGMEHTFLKEAAILPETASTVQQALTEQQVFWNGDWYGYWTISNAQGKWLDQSGQRFDCFARIDIDSEGNGTMVFWDEMQDYSHPIACADILVAGGNADVKSNILLSTGGNFLDSEIKEKQWSVDPSLYPFDSVFYIENAHYQEQDGAFDYSIVLRPWGRTWEDIEASSPDMLPFFYYDWYLPVLLQGGSMPDSFQYQHEPIIRNTWQDFEQEQQG